MLSVALVGFRSFGDDTELNGTAHEIVAALELARDKTLASENASQYGVHFENDAYTLFSGTAYDPNAGDNERHALSAKLELYDIALGGGSDAVFGRVSGTTTNAGSVGLRLADKPSAVKTISILLSGATGLAASVTSTDARITDTRHVHFDLGWSIQNAVTLSLVFSDPPNPSVREDVAMANYFNADQSKFDWSGAVSVNGSSQILRVQTHALDEFDTLLSIRRDRRYNSKAVSILIDGKQIVSYAPDGTATVGGFGGTMEVQ